MAIYTVQVGPLCGAKTLKMNEWYFLSMIVQYIQLLTAVFLKSKTIIHTVFIQFRIYQSVYPLPDALQVCVIQRLQQAAKQLKLRVA